MYRAGLRTGISSLSMAARAKFPKLWCARSHRLCRELDAHDFILRELMPSQVLDMVDMSMSMNISGKPYTGEGPDFRLEEINKKVQQFMMSKYRKVCLMRLPKMNLNGRNLIITKAKNKRRAIIFGTKPRQ